MRQYFIRPLRMTDAARPRKERPRAAAVVEPLGFQYADQHYVPACLTTQFESPFIALRYFFDVQDASAKGASDIAAAARGANGKRGSLRRMLSSTSVVSETETQAIDEQRAAAAIATEAHDVVQRLSATLDAFMHLIIALTGLGDKQQQMETLSFAEYLLIDDSIVDHPRLRRRRLASNALIVANGRLHVQTRINAQTWQDGYGAVEAKRRTATVMEQANRWLADVCKEVCDVFDVLPVTWTLDYKNNERLSNAVLGERSVQASLDMPFLMIGMLDALRLTEPRDTLVRSLLRRLM